MDRVGTDALEGASKGSLSRHPAKGQAGCLLFEEAGSLRGRSARGQGCSPSRFAAGLPGREAWGSGMKGASAALLYPPVSA